MLPTKTFIGVPLKFSRNSHKNSRHNNSNISLVTWEEVHKKQWEAKQVAEKCLSDILKKVEDAVGGEFREKSSCSIIPLIPKAYKDVKPTEDRRLKNWNRWIQIHERESFKLSRSTYRRRKDLLLNLNPNEFRMTKNRKDILEKSADAFGALNFWKIPEKSHKDLLLTMPKSEKVDQQEEIFYTQTPNLTLKEQNIIKTVGTSEILKCLEDAIEERVEFFDPELDHLALKGNDVGDGLDYNSKKFRSNRSTVDSIQLSMRKDKHKIEEKQQMLVINGIKVNSSFFNKDFLVDLVFEGFKLQRDTKSVCLENRGDVAIVVTFKKVQVDAVLFRRPAKMFFFNLSAILIIPGGVIEVPFHFYPNEVGVFQEKWVLACCPEFSQKYEICINLLGQCKKKYKEDDELMKIEQEIMSRAAEYDVEKTIKDLIKLSVDDCNPPRCELFKDPFEDKFAKMNPKLFYHPEPVESLMQIYNELCGNESEWNFNIEELYKMVLNIEDLDKQKKLYEKFNEHINQLRNVCQNVYSDDEKLAKFSMSRNTFGNFFNNFDDVMSSELDQENSMKFHYGSATK